MRVKVSPARKFRNEKTILDQPLEELEIVWNDGSSCLSFCAEGIYDNKSQYRYTIQISLAEIAELFGQAVNQESLDCDVWPKPEAERIQ